MFDESNIELLQESDANGNYSEEHVVHEALAKQISALCQIARRANSEEGSCTAPVPRGASTAKPADS